LVYSKIYQSKPKSILILPPVDYTTSSVSSHNFLYTISRHLSEKGYYVYSPMLVYNFLISENLIEPEMARNIPIAKLREVFDCDAILYVDIYGWDTEYMVASSDVYIKTIFRLVDARTSQEIWKRINQNSSNTNTIFSNDLIGILSSLYTIANTSVDYTYLANESNQRAFETFPAGEYRYNSHRYDQYDDVKIYNNGYYIDADKIYFDNSDFLRGDNDTKEGGFSLKHTKVHPLESGVVSADNIMTLDRSSDFAYPYGGVDSQYYIGDFNGLKVLRNYFFYYDYENNPYIYYKDRVIYIATTKDGKIIVSKDSIGDYLNISKSISMYEYTLKIDIDKNFEGDEN
jgi:hypothetical protein